MFITLASRIAYNIHYGRFNVHVICKGIKRRRRKERLERKRINFHQRDRFDNCFFLCLVSVDVGGNCSCADYLTPLVCLLYFSLSLLCLNRRANTIHSLEIYCINTWRERWCRHPVSRSSLLSVNFIDNDTRRMEECEKRKRKIEIFCPFNQMLTGYLSSFHSLVRSSFHSDRFDWLIFT